MACNSFKTLHHDVILTVILVQTRLFLKYSECGLRPYIYFSRLLLSPQIRESPSMLEKTFEKKEILSFNANFFFFWRGV